MTNLQTAIIYASMIGSMLNEFEQTKRPIEDMKRQIKKFMFKRARSNTKEFEEAIRTGNKIWVEAVDHFAAQELRIDAFSVIVACWSSHADLLSRFVNLTEKRMDAFSMLNDNENLEPERDAYVVADYLNKKIKALP